jgi:hypothetical protein
MANNELIAKVTGVSIDQLPQIMPKQKEVSQYTSHSETILDADFTDTRQKLQDVSELAQDGLVEISRLAMQLQEPRAFDVMAKMISATVAAHKALLEIHKNKQEGKDGAGQPTTVNNTAVFLTTAELQKQLSLAAEAVGK